FSTRASDRLAVGIPGHIVDLAGVAAQGLLLFAVRHVPDFHGAVPADTGQPLAIRAPFHAGDGVGMTLERLHDLSCFDVPNPYDLVPAAGGEMLAVWAPSYGPDGAVLASERLGVEGVVEARLLPAAQVLLRSIDQLAGVVAVAQF